MKARIEEEPMHNQHHQELTGAERLSLLRLGIRNTFGLALCGLILFWPYRVNAQQATVESISHLPTVSPISVQVSGRAQRMPDGMFRYQWPGIYFFASYQGSALYFRLGGGDQDLHINVDGQSLTPLARVADGVYRISSAAAGKHTVRIDVVNENQDSPKSLGNFAVDAGSHGLPIAPGKRQIEFIGDSHTVGYGNTSATRNCSESKVWSTTDTSQSLGADVAVHYRADYQINAISGHGIVRNYNGSPGDPVPVAYPFMFFDKQLKYEDPTWRPSVIVISLGTNDFSTALHPGEPWKSREALHADYEQTYVGFLKSLRQAHPHALIILWATDMADGEISAETGKVAETIRKSGDKRIEFFEASGLSFQGCHFHPSIADDRTIANSIIQIIDKHHDVWPDE
jgi:lysophospholipase L1-like esterase